MKCLCVGHTHRQDYSQWLVTIRMQQNKYMKGKIWIMGCGTALMVALMSFSLLKRSNTSQYKCMIQMANYTGEGAYVIVSLINSKGQYEKTLYVQGDDKQWYKDVKEWWPFYKKNEAMVDGITSASLAGGQRSMFVVALDNATLDAGYSLRFETAVEDKGYHTKDVEFALTAQNLATGKIEGTGFIRYVRITPN